MKFVASPVLDTTMPKASQPGGGEASPSRSPLESSRCQRVKIGLRREKCLSVASCFPFPIFTCWRREPRRGYDPVVLEQCSNPSFAYFSWRSKKSERLPGRPRQTTVDRRKKSRSNRQSKVGTKHRQPQDPPNTTGAPAELLASTTGLLINKASTTGPSLLLVEDHLS